MPVTATVTVTVDEIIDLIHAEIIRAGSLRALAREWGVSHELVHKVHSRRQRPGPAILGRLGIERMTVYLKKEVERCSC